MNGKLPPLPQPSRNFQISMNTNVYELMPAYPFEFGVLTLPLPRFYMRLLQKKGW